MYSFKNMKKLKKTEEAEVLIYRKKDFNSLLTTSIVVLILFIFFKTEPMHDWDDRDPRMPKCAFLDVSFI